VPVDLPALPTAFATELPACWTVCPSVGLAGETTPAAALPVPETAPAATLPAPVTASPGDGPAPVAGNWAPVLAEPPLPLGSFDGPDDDPIFGLRRAAAYAPFTAIANVTGQPAMSVPLHWTDDGLPIGAHFVGRFGDEATLLRLAAQLEQARPWAERRPPVHA